MFLNRDQVSEYGCHQFSAFASDIGMSPMAFATTREIDTNLGNGLTLNCIRISSDKAVFRQTAGCVEVMIYND